MRARKYTRTVFLVPYALVFALLGIVGLQLVRPTSAAPLHDDQIVLRVSQGRYSSGDTVRFVLFNLSDITVTVSNNCPEAPLEVYRRENGGWLHLHSKTDEAHCVYKLRSYDIAPQSSVTVDYGEWRDLFRQSGRYRLVAPLEQQSLRPSVEFDVI